MKIKKIEITGFKSFMEKTTLDFPERITAIVGPNGCGKSNIVDAIRWVIGEQSPKHLRGSGMEDMIFSGSEKHTPLGMAEVKITFTNDNAGVPVNYSEYSEIMVSRRLYKSGESEYKLNNTPCRLMDIRELFMDTGISSKAYAIIEQGKVEKIVSSKPEDKRMIIEEAAGITKYKNRKLSAEKKIDGTKQNLLRTQDILSEIKKQVSAVEKQAKRAEEFKELRKEFREIELQLIKIEAVRLNDSYNTLDSDLKTADEGAQRAGKNYKVKENEIEGLKIRGLEIETELGAMQERYLGALNDIKKKENEIEFKERQKEELAKHKTENTFEIDELRARTKTLKEDIETSKQKIKSAEEDFSKEEKAILSIQSEYEAINGDYRKRASEIDKEKSRLVDILTGSAHARNEISNIENQITSFGKSLEKLKREEGFLKEQALKLSKDIKDSEGLHAQIEKEKEGLKNNSIINGHKLSELEANVREKNKEARSTENELKDVSARLKSLVDLKNNYEGFNSGVKAVMTAKNSIGLDDEILGVVTDFMEVAPQYETAVSAYLGDKLEYVVVKSVWAAQKGVEYLKKSQKGKAGFVIAAVGASPEPDSEDSHISKAITVDDSVKGAILALFENTHYIESFGEALKRYGSNGGRTYITGEGDIVNATVYGGGGKVKGEAILKREREIKALEQNKAALTNRFSMMQKDIELLRREISQTESIRDEIKDSLHAAEIKSIEQRNRMNRAKDEEKRLIEREDIIRYELEGIKSQAEAANNKLELGRVKLEKLQADKLEKEEFIRKISMESEDMRKALDLKNEELMHARVNSARLKAEKENLVKSLNHLISTLDSSVKRADKLKNDIDIIDKEEAEIKRKVIMIERELKENVKTSEDDKEKVLKLKSSFEQNMARQREGEVLLSTIRSELSNIVSAKNELVVKKEEVVLNLRSLQEKLKDKYQEPLEFLDAIEIPADYDKIAALRRVETLRKKINDMGEVNLLAIEEYEELNQRYTFLTEQQEDLLQSINTLNKAIKRINRESRKRFEETFALVNEKFKVLFPKMFNGGHAELIMVDEENVLESGVEIVAQPPGKKQQNISLMSGGEKALTAVSLIFAIFMIKPSPFCLLDEVDAPLDDANIGRFNDLVKDMSETSQFLIITHNKRTMEIADTLYGVTMESPGISQVVSVQMN